MSAHSGSVRENTRRNMARFGIPRGHDYTADEHDTYCKLCGLGPDDSVHLAGPVERSDPNREEQ